MRKTPVPKIVALFSSSGASCKFDFKYEFESGWNLPPRFFFEKYIIRIFDAGPPTALRADTLVGPYTLFREYDMINAAAYNTSPLISIQ